MVRIFMTGLFTLFLIGSINQTRAEIGSFMEFAPSLTKGGVSPMRTSLRIAA
jgi:hypothetical protein